LSCGTADKVHIKPFLPYHPTLHPKQPLNDHQTTARTTNATILNQEFSIVRSQLEDENCLIRDLALAQEIPIDYLALEQGVQRCGSMGSSD
jgi:hypothetical protein